MMRITYWHQINPPPPDTPPTALVSAFNEFAQAAKKVPGAGEVRWGFGGGGVVTVGFPSSYAVADAILEGRAVWDSARRDREAESEKRTGSTQNIAERVRAREARRERIRAHTPKPVVRGRTPAGGARTGAEAAEVVATDEPTAD